MTTQAQKEQKEKEEAAAAKDKKTPAPTSVSKETEERNKKQTEAVKQIQKLTTELAGDTAPKLPTSQRYDKNPNSTPPGERSLADTPTSAATSQLTSAALALNAASDAYTLQADSDKRLKSDPRYERDQKIFELGQTGIPIPSTPSTGIEPLKVVVIQQPPASAATFDTTDVNAQVKHDMEVLNKAQQDSRIPPGEQDGPDGGEVLAKAPKGQEKNFKL